MAMVSGLGQFIPIRLGVHNFNILKLVSDLQYTDRLRLCLDFDMFE